MNKEMMNQTEKTKLSWETEAGSWSLDFSHPLIMSIINLTPDSFSDGGRFSDSHEALAAALKEEENGADIIDLGAESTRPGAASIDANEEWSRLKNVIEGIRAKSSLPISVDTYRAEVAEKALKAGAAIINDIYAGRNDERMFELAAQYNVPIILMHMQGEPGNMQKNPQYNDVVSEVHDFLLERAQAAEAAGVSREKIILDPGIGFGKNLNHNLSIIKNFDKTMPQDYKKLMALSRKAFLGHISNNTPPQKRDGLTAVANTLAILKGADIIRVHNSADNKAAINLLQALNAA